MIPHNRLTHGAAEIRAVAATLRSGRWTQGPVVLAMEKRLAAMAGVRHAVGVASGLSALRLTLIGLGVRAGDRVLVPAYACVALANAVLACGASPIPVDVIPGQWTLCPDACRAKARQVKPKAIIVVNLFGVPAPVAPLMDLGIPVIEDCAHAFGFSVEGQALGGRTQAAVLSFYATKLIGAGEGGAVLTRSADVARVVRTWRDYGDQPMDGSRLNDKMSDVEAALVLCQLDRLPAMLHARTVRARRYFAGLSRNANARGWQLPAMDPARIWYRYTVLSNRITARAMVRTMARAGVQCAQPVKDWRPPAGRAVTPVASRAYRQLVSLPLYPTLSRAEQDRVLRILSHSHSHYGKTAGS